MRQTVLPKAVTASHKADKRNNNMKITDILTEAGQRLDPSCWSGYKKQGTKMKGGKRVNNCVKEDGSVDVMATVNRALKDLKIMDPQGGVSNSTVEKAAALATSNPGAAVNLLIRGFNTERKQASMSDVYNSFVDTFSPPEQDDPFSYDNLKRDKIASEFPKRRRY